MAKRTVVEVHQAGGHRDRKRVHCPLCERPKPYMTATNRPAMAEPKAIVRTHWGIREGFGYCTPAGIR